MVERKPKIIGLELFVGEVLGFCVFERDIKNECFTWIWYELDSGLQIIENDQHSVYFVKILHVEKMFNFTFESRIFFSPISYI